MTTETPSQPRVDCHVHAFPDRLALAVRNMLGQRGQLTADPLLPGVAEQVRDEGFDAAWILPYAHRPGVAEGCNEWSAQEVKKYPWLVPGATFHPGDEGFARLVERALVELRLRVVKLHCSVGQFKVSDERLTPLWECAAQQGVPVLVHAGFAEPGMTRPEEVEDIELVLRAHPGLRLVLAHSGQPNIATALRLLDRYENLHADLTPVWLAPIEVAASDLRRFSGRFLFGSDAPNCPIPVADLVARVGLMELSEDEKAAILGGNAARLAPVEVGA